MGLHPVSGPKRCPRCGANANDASAQRHSASSLPPGLDLQVLSHYDGILYWSCNHCAQTWHHWDITSPVHHIAAKYLTGQDHA